MPFLALPKDESLLRFQDGEITFHYMLSTPGCQTFVHASLYAASFCSVSCPLSRPRHRKATASSTNINSNSSSSSSASLSRSRSASTTELKLDPNYPILFFLPSECFSCIHLFSKQLCDLELANQFNLVAVDPRGHGLTKDVPIGGGAGNGKRYDLDIKAADILDFIQLLCNRVDPVNQKTHWDKGIHLLACSMSGLVATRMAAKWPNTFSSIIVTSPILELESEFIIESFQGVKQLLQEAWHEAHDTIRPCQVTTPGEVIQGFGYRWAGQESIPHHIESYLSRTWLDRLILKDDGLQAARDWWFDLYWLRQPMNQDQRQMVHCDLLVIEGCLDLPDERQVGLEFEKLFPNVASFKYKVIPDSPFLISVTRARQLKKIIVDYYYRRYHFNDHKFIAAEETVSIDQVIESLTPDERFELIKVYAPDSLSDSDDDSSDQDDSLDDIDRPTRSSSESHTTATMWKHKHAPAHVVRTVQETYY